MFATYSWNATGTRFDYRIGLFTYTRFWVHDGNVGPEMFTLLCFLFCFTHTRRPFRLNLYNTTNVCISETDIRAVLNRIWFVCVWNRSMFTPCQTSLVGFTHVYNLPKYILLTNLFIYLTVSCKTANDYKNIYARKELVKILLFAIFGEIPNVIPLGLYFLKYCNLCCHNKYVYFYKFFILG